MFQVSLFFPVVVNTMQDVGQEPALRISGFKTRLHMSVCAPLALLYLHLARWKTPNASHVWPFVLGFISVFSSSDNSSDYICHSSFSLHLMGIL